ncbi:MAG: hypothetical protein ACRDT4_00660 [Micromonosporaceae bacterium]
MQRTLLAAPLAVALAAALGGAGPTWAHPDDQHGGAGGHLPGSSENVELVGQLTVSGASGADKPGHIADVASHRDFAYLAARRLNTSPCGVGGFYTVDISDPANPTEVSFTAFPLGTYPGEGMHVIEVNTPAFKGDVLVTNNENCGVPGSQGGISLYDVTDPHHIAALAVGFGDRTPLTGNRAHTYHSAFGWQAGKRAFVMAADNEEQATLDVEIIEITDPRNPVFLRETGWNDWPAATSFGLGDTVFNHDFQVKKVSGHYLGLLSYWDLGWVILNLDDPANPVFVRDSRHPSPDPLLGFEPPEGNSHQGEWSHDNEFIIGTDEDFSPTRLDFQITTGPHAGRYGAGQFGWTIPISQLPNGEFTGNTVWGGTGCVEDTDGNGVSDRDEVPPKSATGAEIVVFTRGTCFFSIKVESGQLAGYDKAIVIQSHAGSRGGQLADGFFCGGQGHAFDITSSAICIGHRAGHLLFDDAPNYTGPDGQDIPLGTLGASVLAKSAFDGWGTVHLLNGRTLAEIDNYAVPEGIDPAFQTGFGVLSVHEVAMDKAENLAYLSYYDAGMRVVRFGAGGMEEVGHYIHEDGNDFWGVQAHRLPADPTETTYILGSDRDSGLWIFRYTGD